MVTNVGNQTTEHSADGVNHDILKVNFLHGAHAVDFTGAQYGFYTSASPMADYLAIRVEKPIREEFDSLARMTKLLMKDAALCELWDVEQGAGNDVSRWGRAKVKQVLERGVKAWERDNGMTLQEFLEVRDFEERKLRFVGFLEEWLRVALDVARRDGAQSA